MKLIAHRGNIDGPSDDQNDPDYIDNALSLGYDAEICLLYTSPSPRDKRQSRMPSSA